MMRHAPPDIASRLAKGTARGIALALAAPAALLAASLLCHPASAQALDMSHGGPVEVTATDGIDWNQNAQTVTARGNARAVRDNVTVTADRLIAYYRKKAAPPGQPAKPAQSATTDVSDTGSSEIYRLEAVGHVHIFTATDQAWGDKAVYDIDQAVLVLTGGALRLTTPQDVLTARDSMEYWSQTRMSVARGNAVVVTADGRRLSGDTLVGYSSPPTPAPAGPASPGQATPAAQAAPAKPAATGGKPADPLMASGKLERVEAYGNVEVRTATEIVHGDRGVYVPDTGRARILGHVRITRGENQVNGMAADVDMKTGISTLLSGPAARVEGLIMPNDAKAASGAAPGAPSAPAATTPSPGKRP
jgi:lipopolysaccharide export system protein LptA